MPQEHVSFEMVNPEDQAEIEDALRLVVSAVCAKLGRRGKVSAVWTVERNAKTGNLETRLTVDIGTKTRKAKRPALIRDGQMVLPGTGVLSDMEPGGDQERTVEAPREMYAVGGRR